MLLHSLHCTGCHCGFAARPFAVATLDPHSRSSLLQSSLWMMHSKRHSLHQPGAHSEPGERAINLKRCCRCCGRQYKRMSAYSHILAREPSRKRAAIETFLGNMISCPTGSLPERHRLMGNQRCPQEGLERHQTVELCCKLDKQTANVTCGRIYGTFPAITYHRFLWIAGSVQLDTSLSSVSTNLFPCPVSKDYRRVAAALHFALTMRSPVHALQSTYSFVGKIIWCVEAMRRGGMGIAEHPVGWIGAHWLAFSPVAVFRAWTSSSSVWTRVAQALPSPLLMAFASAT